MVVDARNGEVLHARNADTRLHPASLTKMMTLYVAFEAIENGEISLNTPVLISQNAASEPPSKLGLRAGQKIVLRYLIRAAAVKSANDAATAIGEAVAGSESAFTERMNRTARALGMRKSTFRNAHGLTQDGHLSTARDMTVLGRHLFYDYPEYYNLFSRERTDAGLKEVRNTNRRLLSDYPGADGIKTGFTNAAGYNLVASAERGRKRVIATVFGGKSTASRNAQVAELMDMGFSRMRERVAVRKPSKPRYRGGSDRRQIEIAQSRRPRMRPEQVDNLASQIVAAVASAQSTRSRPTQNLEVVTRMASSGGRNWGINVGRYTTRYEAEQILLKTALTEIGTLDEALRKVSSGSAGWEANFVGMTQERAALACRRLQARSMPCTTLGPG
ncbi:D-alanyl-D-alanine carboxypeptidase family protein [Palleronia caenipelagi]|uniref:D-alanyl-D-alanine carboxypeptidase n=1 Tax=Palleronia caenipelagi TaxID=2489174 RepID=A0A547Q5U3_9RHOB|nr:D-alanyl-D-alanine carboxypeptidase family protein [Palleronia caenipelagi]TRD21750.1 D-alanyl-D-alanine carboxypeptidase [Palleronia caenipelagi]